MDCLRTSGLGAEVPRTVDPPLKRAFCRFCLDLQPQRIVLTHLEEFGRRAADFWEVDKADGVHQCLRELDHRVVVEKAMMGDCVLL